MNDSNAANGSIKGKENSFEDILSSYEKKVFSFTYHMVRDIQTSEDLTQDVFLKVYQNMYRINDGFLLKPWIYKIAYNTTLNYLKKKKKTSICSIDENISGRDVIGQYETKYIILNEIQSFEPDSRAIFILKFIEDLSFEQIALMLGKSTGAIKMKFYRSKKDLANRLAESLKEV